MSKARSSSESPKPGFIISPLNGTIFSTKSGFISLKGSKICRMNIRLVFSIPHKIRYQVKTPIKF